jgi:hypothetical protein
MKTVEKWRWRTLWAGRMRDGKLYYTEAEILARHPEAERIAGTMRLVDVPETDEERQAADETMRRPARNFRPE